MKQSVHTMFTQRPLFGHKITPYFTVWKLSPSRNHPSLAYPDEEEHRDNTHQGGARGHFRHRTVSSSWSVGWVAEDQRNQQLR